MESVAWKSVPHVTRFTMTKPSRPSKRAKQGLASRRRRSKSERTVFTVGHSTRPLADFIHLLQCYGMTLVIDVRKMPRSRANPQYNHCTTPLLRLRERASMG